MKKYCVLFVAVGACASIAGAHDGRRFEVQIIGGQLAAQGYISNGIDDGGGVVRPYLNAIHGHWENDPGLGVTFAAADLPGFDLFDAGPMAGFDLTLTLTGAHKWVAPPTEPDPGTIPDLEDLEPGEEIFVSFEGEFVSTSEPGSLTLIDPVPTQGADDLDLSYEIADEPTNVLYVLEFILSTTAPGVSQSGAVHVILAPDHESGGPELHHAAIFLESYLGLDPSPACVGDVTGDGRTNVSDFNILASHFGQSVPPGTNGDLTGNGFVNVSDFNLLAGDFGCLP